MIHESVSLANLLSYIHEILHSLAFDIVEGESACNNHTEQLRLLNVFKKISR